VLVTLDATGIAFERPLRTESPYSAHKRGSTIPHRFGAPRYADGTQARDLAACLELVATTTGGGSTEAFTSQPDDFSAGSTAWRWDPDAGHYVFNAKTDASWPTGVWTTTVSCRGVVLARTIFELRR
jgi:hypothetical protein